MALIKCPECSKEISNTVKRCPHCGFKLSKKNLANYQAVKPAVENNSTVFDFTAPNISQGSENQVN